MSQTLKINRFIARLSSPNQGLGLNVENTGTEPVNVLIRSHETQTEDWEFGETAQELYVWYDRFNTRFFDPKLGDTVLSFEKSRITTLGHYVLGRNGIGITNNINLNSRHLNRPKWELLRTLLHEMLHQYQVSFSGDNKSSHNNYHKKAFRTTAKLFGIPCDSRGQSIDPPTDPFVGFIRQHGVDVELEKIAPISGSSKLKKFFCQCNPPVNVRVADVSRFSAKCNHCSQNFKSAEVIDERRFL